MTEHEQINRIVEIVKINSYVLKVMRRFMLKWMRGIEDESKLQYKDIQQMKERLIAVAKKIKLEGIDDLGKFEEPEDTGESLYIPKSEKDLHMPKYKPNREEWSYFT